MPIIRTTGNAPDLADLIPALPHGRQWLNFWNSAETLCAHLQRHNYTWRKHWERPQFSGSESLNDAARICRDGWPEGTEAARRIRDKIAADTPRAPRIIRHDMAGAVPNVPRAIAGNPQHMRRADPTRTRRRPVLTLISELSVSARTNPNAIRNRAGVVTAVVDAIEGAGFACHVLAYDCSISKPRQDEGTAVVTLCTLKEAGDAADLDRLSFGLGHPAMLRRICFHASTQDDFTKPIDDHVGYPRKLAPTDAMRHAQVYVLPSCQAEAEQHFATVDRAASAGLAYVLDALAQQGCPAFQDRDAAA